MPRSLETARGLCTIAACGHYGLEQLCAVALALGFATMTKVCVCVSVCLCVCVFVCLCLCLCALGGGSAQNEAQSLHQTSEARTTLLRFHHQC